MMEKKMPKAYNRQYMAVCSACGSCEWIDNEEEMNWLTKDGGQKNKKTIKELKSRGGGIICAQCERVLKPISFGLVDQTMRKKVFRMTPDERKSFAKSFELMGDLEK